MATMDIFNASPFRMTSLTDGVNKTEYVPRLVSSLNLFSTRRVTTEAIAIEERDGVLNVLPTSNRGAPLGERTTEKRVIRNFNTARLATGDTVYAAEIQGLRAFGQESELQSVQNEVMRRYSGDAGMVRQFEMTWENQRLGAVQGIVVDADGSSVIYNWFTEFNVTQAAEIDFDLDNATPESGAVRKKCNQVIRQMARGAQGAWIDGSTSVVGLCGDAFWDDLTAHSEVRSTYLNQQEASELRKQSAWQSLSYGGITFINYRGTDDNSKVAVGTDDVKFFPRNAPGAFVQAFSPGEFFGAVNRPGMDLYARRVIDPNANGNMEAAAYVRLELYSYPLFICTRPKMLQRGKRT